MLPSFLRRPLRAGVRATVVSAATLVVGASVAVAASDAGPAANGRSPGIARPPAPSGDVTLAAALAAALERSPVLAAWSCELRAKDAEILQSRARPNPQLATEIEDVGGSGKRHGFDGSQTTISLAQLVELGGKRETRTRIARLEREVAGQEYEAARLALLSETAQAFVAALALQERLTLARHVVDLSEESVAAVRRTKHEGGASEIDVSRAEVAAEQARIAASRLTHDLQAAKATLASAWDADATGLGRLLGNLRAVAEPPAYAIFEAALDANPELARWNSEIARRESLVTEQKQARIPDLTLSIGPRYYADDDSAGLVAGFSLPLPLFDRNEGGILAARQRVRQAESQKSAARATAGAQLRGAYEELAAAWSELAALRERAIPEAERALEGSGNAWKAGRLRYLEVLDAQRTLFELRDSELQSLASYHRARCSIERLTGRPVEPEGL